MKRVLLACLLFPVLALAESTYREGDPFLPGSIGTYAWCVDPGGNNAYCKVDGSGALITICAGTLSIPAVFGPQLSLAAGGMGGAYVNVGLLPTNTRILYLDNQTDGEVQVSIDGGVTDHFYLKSGDMVTINLGSIDRDTSAMVAAKDGTDAPTTGTFFVYSVK